MTAPTPGSPTDVHAYVDLARLGSYIARTLGVEPRPLAITGQAKSGSSNVTLFLDWGGEEWVLRRPPLGPLLPTAHDMIREYRFLTGLAGTPVPIPVPILSCEDPEVIGAPFYIMRRVHGILLQDGYPPEVDTPEARRQTCEAAIDALVALHAVDWEARGFTDRPSPYIDRQIRLWDRQLQLTPTKDRLPGLEKVGDWLRERRPPPAKPTIVHGDFGLHNMILSARPPVKVEAILDWEMATIGDPAADAIWFLRGWGQAPNRNPANYVTAMPGALTADEMLARYEERSGRRIEHRRFYEVFSRWKGAIILEGLYASYLEGNAANENVARFATEVPQAVEQLLATLS